MFGETAGVCNALVQVEAEDATVSGQHQANAVEAIALHGGHRLIVGGPGARVGD